MTGNEYCRYIRTYTPLEGLQQAHRVVYQAWTVPLGVMAQLRREQDGRAQCSTILTPPGSFGRVMQLLRYLSENSIGPEQWLEVLEDAGQAFEPLDQRPEETFVAENRAFCGIC